MLHCTNAIDAKVANMRTAYDALSSSNDWEQARKRSEKIVFGTCFLIVAINTLLVIFL